TCCTQKCNINFTVDQTFLPVLYGCVFCVGLPVNILALYGLYRLVKANYTLSVFIINLLLSDLLHISTLPFWIDYYRRGHKWMFGYSACRIIGYMFGTSLYASVCFMCCIALERYLAIVYPLWFRSHRRMKFACLLCLSVWVLVIAIQSVGYSFGFERTRPASDLCLESYPKSREFAVFQLVVMPFTFVLPVLLFGILFARIHRSLHKESFMPDRKKKRITHLLLLVLLIYVVIYGPYHVTAFALCIGALVTSDRCRFESDLFVFFRVTVGILSLNPVLDPILYAFIGNDFREAL
uniref:G-protein coupled receptors family 1 profile domain-containing protein n=1 Tax=Lepisosteus oculatus TaxID=7918 RepID=W5LVR6_LEPOC